MKSITKTKKILMNVDIECFPCFLRQVVIALSNLDLNSRDKIKIIKATLEDIENTDIDLTPAHTTTIIHRKIRALTGRDPFKEIKKKYNEVALSLYSGLKKIVLSSEDPLKVATRLAVAGNAIDFGIYTEVDIHSEIKRALNDGFAIDHYDLFKEKIMSEQKMLYLLDNAGEIVFDRILIETLIDMGKDVTAIVKGAPVINDATLEDAVSTGITDVCDVRDNGSDAIGTILQWSSEEFRELFEASPFVVSKGQGNFETLLCEEKDIFFLFQSKCGVVSDRLGVKKGGMIILDSEGIH